MSDPKTTDYCLKCGESPASATHTLLVHHYQDPRDVGKACRNCDGEGRWAHPHNGDWNDCDECEGTGVIGGNKKQGAEVPEVRAPELLAARFSRSVLGTPEFGFKNPHSRPSGDSGADMLPVDDSDDGDPAGAALVALRELATYFELDRPWSALKLREIARTIENEMTLLRAVAETPCPDCTQEDAD